MIPPRERDHHFAFLVCDFGREKERTGCGKKRRLRSGINKSFILFRAVLLMNWCYVIDSKGREFFETRQVLSAKPRRATPLRRG
jgi:hypothetical protein